MSCEVETVKYIVLDASEIHASTTSGQSKDQMEAKPYWKDAQEKIDMATRRPTENASF